MCPNRFANYNIHLIIFKKLHCNFTANFTALFLNRQKKRAVKTALLEFLNE